MNPSKQRNLWLWAAACIGVAAIFIVFLAASLAGGRGDVLLPLDDVYIHFQYARQLALGQPYVYNPGQPPTSGATSFLYPYILAAGYLLGFHDLNLGLWAMIVGALALLASIAAVYRICRALGASWQLAAFATALFALTGSFSWHFMSGMETGLMVAFSLWTLFVILAERPRAFALVASLLALVRPEGSMMAVIASIISIGFLWRYTTPKRRLLWYLLPLLALLVQPFANWLITGTALASGSQAKSLLGLVPHNWHTIISRILENFARMWLEFMTGYGEQGWYLPIGLGPLGMVGLLLMAFSRQRSLRRTAIIIALWLIVVSAAIATLDTAFWHFKRYQMPLMVLFVPLAVYALHRLNIMLVSVRFLSWAYAGMLLLFGFALTGQFLNNHFQNITYVYAQPLSMARWLAENTPEDAVVAVHDVGMMRYMGNRTTLDIVGLTTPGAAAYWRNGPGSVAEYLIQQQPDYIASYGVGHGYGLRLLAETSLYENVLAEFPVTLDRSLNVALAADYQAIYKPDWQFIEAGRQVPESLIAEAEQRLGEDMQYALMPESSAMLSPAYAWRRDANITGFPSVVYEFDRTHCTQAPCSSLHGGRAVNWERIRIQPRPATDQAMIFVLRVHSLGASSFDVYVDTPTLERQYLTTKVVAAIPGEWQDIPILIPGDFVSADDSDEDWLDIELISETGYESYAHWAFIGHEVAIEAPENRIASYQDGAFTLTDVDSSQEDDQLGVEFSWYNAGTAAGDYRYFVHLYKDIETPPVTQWDGYLSGGAVGNWLPGMRQDTVMVNLHEIPSGTYTLAVGFYNPQDPLERLIPVSARHDVLPDGRLILGDVTVE
ncbi:hypothetical protein G4Y79_17585 [Phototrophicus methaneseepsis]|uniref:Glycosyltransferase RgtA/B/C/D-like domain-containing protein n=1 Tax=Phototrophicus methaneseepsis TaxID=2710758 RepID=A0A7S8E6X6_9CHLR|nr:hypothetical protein [Phototrophicus methaneseepsis]QPC81490.1 hypothetical protein G4Y79_17585 [Phototrophicus methaneseepsis]